MHVCWIKKKILFKTFSTARITLNYGDREQRYTHANKEIR